jgi:putative FmdB family regulatory protein
MPIYEFECDKCHEVFEINQSFTDPVPGKCPGCGQEGSLSKIISRTSFQLKGSGWYASDYKGNAKAPPKPGAWADPGPARKSYLDQTPSERKSTIKDLTNSVANKL